MQALENNKLLMELTEQQESIVKGGVFVPVRPIPPSRPIPRPIPLPLCPIIRSILERLRR